MNHLDISVDLSPNELSRRLKVLLKSLTDLEASAENAAEYGEVAQKLAEDVFMNHNSREIRILAACCIADILRIFHPDSPYGDHATAKNVLMFLAKQLRGLENVKDTLYPRYYYLLENLTTVKTLMLLLDLENSQDVTMMLIRNLLASVNGEVNEERISGFVVDIITPLLREAELIPFKLLDPLMLPLTEPHKSQSPFAAKLAARIIAACETNLESTIQAFFAQTLSSTEPLKSSQLSLKTCEIFFELYKICPDVLLPSMSQLANRLLVPDEALRLETMKLVCKLLKEDKTGLGDDHSALFEAYLGRFTDIKPDVRINCLRSIPELIESHESMKDRLFEELMSRCKDTDDGVRKEAVSVCSVLIKRLLHKTPDQLYKAIIERMRDKKFSVRKEAMVSLATFYRKVSLKEGASEALKAQVQDFRKDILRQYWNGTIEDKILCEKLFHTCLVPYQLGCEQRMKMLFSTFLSLDDAGPRSSLKAVQGIIQDQAHVRKYLKMIIELHKQEESESRRNRIQFFLKALSNLLAEPMKNHEDLKQFYLMLGEDSEAFECLEYIMGTSYTTKHIEDSVREMMKRLSGDKAQSGIKGTVTSLLERVAPLMLDTESMEVIFGMTAEVLDEDPEGTDEEQELAQERALGLIKVLAKAFPHTCLSEAILNHVIVFLEGSNNQAVEVALCVLNELGKDLERVEDGRFRGLYSRLIPILTDMAKAGTAKQVKQAIRCINNIVTDDERKMPIFSSIFKFLKSQVGLCNINCVSALTGIGLLGQFAPERFKDEINKLNSNIVPGIILKSNLKAEEDEGEDKRFVPRRQLSSLSLAKIAGMKLIVRWLIGIKSSTEKVAEKTATMLKAFLETRGDPKRDAPLNSPEKPHLRLVAGSMLLKLAQIREYRPLLHFEHMQSLSTLLYDEFPEVRGIFLAKLRKALNGSLPVDFLALFTAVRHAKPKDSSITKLYIREAENSCSEVIKHRRNMALQYPERKQVQYFHPECAVPYAVYLLSRHPKLKHCGEVRVLEELRECLWTLLGPLINLRKPDGTTAFEYVYKLLQAIKDHRDARCPKEDPQNQLLWVICDIGILLIQYRGIDTKLKSNLAINFTFDNALFKKEFASGQNTTVYIPQELIDHEKRSTVRFRKQGTKQGARTAAQSKADTTNNSRKRRNEAKVVEEPAASPVKKRNVPGPKQSTPVKRPATPAKSPARVSGRVSGVRPLANLAQQSKSPSKAESSKIRSSPRPLNRAKISKPSTPSPTKSTASPVKGKAVTPKPSKPGTAKREAAKPNVAPSAITSTRSTRGLKSKKSDTGAKGTTPARKTPVSIKTSKTSLAKKAVASAKKTQILKSSTPKNRRSAAVAQKPEPITRTRRGGGGGEAKNTSRTSRNLKSDLSSDSTSSAAKKETPKPSPRATRKQPKRKAK